MSVKKHTIYNYITYRGAQYQELSLSYEVFGLPLHTAPIVLINHALTGNSDVMSAEKGWWKDIIGNQKLIDTEKYTVIAFNVLGNGYDGLLIDNYKDFIAKDIARLFYTVLKELEIKQLYAIMGGSLGGGIAWEMASLYPNFSEYIIPIASDWKATDWIIAHNYTQESILLHSSQPLQDARKMAMLFYRTPAAFGKKFQRTRTEENSKFNTESWLEHHGNKLVQRFDVKAYLMMNHLLTTIDITKENEPIEETLQSIQSKIVQVAISSDIFFVKEENLQTQIVLNQLGVENEYHEIQSEEGHDAFLIEFQQLTEILKPIFNKRK